MAHLSVVTEITDRPLDSWDGMGWGEGSAKLQC